MTQIIAVLGSTGAQGGSVVRKLLKDKTWHVRALTRNVNSDAAKSLKDEGAEMVAANLDDEKSLLKAFDVSFLPRNARLPDCCVSTSSPNSPRLYGTNFNLSIFSSCPILSEKPLKLTFTDPKRARPLSLPSQTSGNTCSPNPPSLPVTSKLNKASVSPMPPPRRQP